MNRRTRTAERPLTYLGDAFVTICRSALTRPVLLLLLLAFLLAALLPVAAFASVPAAPGTVSASPKEVKAGAMKRGDKDTKERTAKGDKKVGKATEQDKDKREIQEATGCRFAK